MNTRQAFQRRKILLNVFAFVVSLTLVASDPASAKSLEQVVEAARSLARETLIAKTPGLSVAVGLDGKMIWSEGFGFADLESKKPVTTQTLFRIGSVSKPFTAAGLMLLVEKGQLDLDADIHQYIPDFPDKGQIITTRLLAGHLAGIRHYKGDEFLLNRPFPSVRDSLKIFENDPLQSRPGDAFLYSSYGWNLISRVIEVGAKQDFLPYMDWAVFVPLGMKSTMPDYADREIPLLTRFYELKKNGGFKVAPTVDNSYKWAGGGFLSTAEDMVRFGTAHLDAGFLKRESLDAMFTSQKTSDGKPTTYGIGWSILKDEKGHRIVTHTGGSVGGTSVLRLHPSSRVVIAIISNCSPFPVDKKSLDNLTEEFSELFTGK